MGDPLSWFAWIKVAAFICGLLFGSFAIGSTSWIWLRRQILTLSAGWLSTLGTALIGMSIWQSIEIEGHGFKLIISEIEKLEREIQLAREDVIGSTVAAAGVDRDDIDDLLSKVKGEFIIVNRKRAESALQEAGYSDEEIEDIADTLGKAPDSRPAADQP